MVGAVALVVVLLVVEGANWFLKLKLLGLKVFFGRLPWTKSFGKSDSSMTSMLDRMSFNKSVDDSVDVVVDKR